ncbi:MAG: carbohydrate porin [Elusimicrobiaceae bacterium]|nr:carbohydrate porin [Elusimicrobiaceae bacterium]
MNMKHAAWGLMAVCLFLSSATYAQNATQHTAKHHRRLAQQQELHQSHPYSFGQDYLQMKQDLADKTGIQYGLDISYLLQRGAPNGKQTAIQGYYYPYITWDVFKDTFLGSGQINANYNLIRYWGSNGTTLQNRLGLASAPNDYTENEEIFSQFSYTHTLPNHLDWLSVTVGQFPLYNFDGGNYLDNQQTALLNFAMSQNASSTYPSASFGGYVQAAPGDWTFAAGWQDGQNISGQNIQLNDAFDGRYTWFGSASYAPTIAGLGAGQYSFLYYYQPAVKEQDETSRGWSVNISQNLGEKWALSARANGSDGHIAPIKKSFVLAASLLNPLDRNTNDAITLGVAYNRTDKKALGYPAEFKNSEMAVELQWVWGIGKLMTITPDIQFYPKSAAGNGNSFTTVASLRTTIML